MKYFHQHPFEIHQACARACQGPTNKKKKKKKTLPTDPLFFGHVTPNTDIFF